MRLPLPVLLATLFLTACGSAAGVNTTNTAVVASTNTALPVTATRDSGAGDALGAAPDKPAAAVAKPGSSDGPVVTKPGVGGDQASNAATNTADSAAAAQCQARGGIYGPVCLSGSMECVMRYPDANRPCTDGSQCQGGACYYEGSTPRPNQRVSGHCVQSSNPCGCHARVENGVTQGALCVD